jgi:hypothetical protein
MHAGEIVQLTAPNFVSSMEVAEGIVLQNGGSLALSGQIVCQQLPIIFLFYITIKKTAILKV